VVDTGTMTTVGWRLLSATGDKNCGVSTSGLIRVYAKTNAEQNQSSEANPVGEIREVRILVPDPADCTATTEVTYDFTEIATLIGADPADGFTHQATHPVDQATCESELPDFNFGPGACSFGNGNIKAAVNDYTEGGGNGQYKDDSDYAGCGLIGTWDVSGVTNMYDLFYATPKPFNEDISGWDVSNVTTMDSMFFSSAFNQNISKWDVSNVRNMNMMFKGTAAFNNGGEPLNWDVSGVTNMYGLFSFARKFNQDISGWDVSNVTDMTLMFEGAEAFANQDISSWCVSKIGNKPDDFDRKNPGFAEERQPNWGTCGTPHASDETASDSDGDGTPDAEDDTPGGPQ
jgi:surface protein